jgi:hypothetical protein
VSEAEAAAAFALRFLAVLFAEDFVAAVLPAARFAAHRFLSAATMFRLPSADNFRFGFLAATSGAGADVAFFAAHRRFCASAIARLPAALIVRLRGVGSAVGDAPFVLPPSSRRTSAICSSICCLFEVRFSRAAFRIPVVSCCATWGRAFLMTPCLHISL